MTATHNSGKSRKQLFATATVMLAALTILPGCGGQKRPVSPGDVSEMATCEVTVHARDGKTFSGKVLGLRSDVRAAFGRSSTAVLEGDEVVIKGWLGDVRVGTASESGFVLRVRNKPLPSAPIVDGATSLEWEVALGTARLEFTSAGCENEELALGGAHLAVLATKPSPASKPVKAP